MVMYVKLVSMVILLIARGLVSELSEVYLCPLTDRLSP